MTISVTNLTGGPAELRLDDIRTSHTHGGITVKVSPKNRMRTVDQYGNTPVDVIHQGDDVRVTAPLAEWSARTLAHVYSPGNDQTAGGSLYLGIGREAGFIYTDFDLKVIPLLTADAGKYSQFYRATPVGEFELSHNIEDDRVLKAEFVCLADPEGVAGSASAGQLIGKIFVSGTAPTTTAA